MSSNKPLSPRAQKALDILENGGKFVERLEDTYQGRPQFHTRLLLKGSIMKGFGAVTKAELNSMLCILNGGTSGSTYYGLPHVHTPAKPQQF